MFQLKETSISGCVELQPVKRGDARGHFVKVFHEDAFREHGLPSVYAEQYYSRSKRGVLRGLHFQTPPFHHGKLVYCVQGAVLDAAVDLRVGSASYGQHVLIELSAEKANVVFVPAGLAHGVFALSDEAMIVNNTTTVYSAEADAGIAWDSAGIPWPHDEPLLSDRDRALPSLADYRSPFRYGTA